MLQQLRHLVQLALQTGNDDFNTIQLSSLFAQPIMDDSEFSPRSSFGVIIDFCDTVTNPFEGVFVFELPWICDRRQHASDGILSIPLDSFAQKAHDFEVQLRYRGFDSGSAIDQSTTSSKIQSITDFNESLCEFVQQLAMLDDALSCVSRLFRRCADRMRALPSIQI